VFTIAIDLAFGLLVFSGLLPHLIFSFAKC